MLDTPGDVAEERVGMPRDIACCNYWYLAVDDHALVDKNSVGEVKAITLEPLHIAHRADGLDHNRCW